MLKRGLQKAGVGAETFELQRDPHGPFGWRAPYRGLEALEPEDAAVLFGRDVDLVRGIDALRGLAARTLPRILVILGASGAGKSSYLRAGLWPRLLRDDSQWLLLRTIRAGRGGAIEGSEGLLSAIEDVHRRFDLRASRADLRERLESPESFVALLRELREAAARRALIAEPPYPLPILCLDQGEELFAADAGAESGKLLKLVRGAIDAGEALLLVTIRSDSYGLMQAAQVFAGVEQVPVSLGPLPRGELGNIIREPAEILRSKVGPQAPVFDAEVVARLQAEIAGEEDALPLLAFVMQRLMREHAAAPTISLKELDRTGGVAAAIESAADAALDDAGIGRDRSAQRDALRRLFIPRLARIDPESKAPQRRTAPQANLPRELLPLAHALTERRLLVVKLAAHAESGSPDAATIEVAHEALLRRWPTLADLLAEDRDALLLLDGVLSAAADWNKADAERKPDFLAHRGSRLSDAQALAARGPDWEREIVPARAYLAACAARETGESEAKEAALAREQAQVARTRKLQKRAGWALAAVFVAVIAALAGALWQSYQTSRREAAVFTSVGETAFRSGPCYRASRLAVAGRPPARGASPLSYSSPELAGDLSLFASSYDCRFQMALSGHREPVNSAAFSPDGTRIVTASGSSSSLLLFTDYHSPSTDFTARVWDAKTGVTLATLSGHADMLESAMFSPDGTRIVTASRDKTARVWDAKTGAALATLSGHTNVVRSAAFSPDGARIVTASWDDTARLWDAKTGAVIATLLKAGGYTSRVEGAAFSPDGTRVVTTSDGTVDLWDVGTCTGTCTALATMCGSHAAFSQDGTRIVTAYDYNTARLWDAKTGAALATLQGEQDSAVNSVVNLVTSVTFSPDGTRVVAASWEKSARVWDAKTGAVLATLTGHIR
jgi:hypothetical protein